MKLCDRLRELLMLPYDLLALSKIFFDNDQLLRDSPAPPPNSVLCTFVCACRPYQTALYMLFLLIFVHICVCAPVKSSLISETPCTEPNQAVSKGIIGSYGWVHLI